MADSPFGFSLPGDPDKDPDDTGGQSGGGQSGGGQSGGGQPPADGGPFGGMGPLGALGDPQQFAHALRQFADLMSWKGGPVKWDLAKNVARHAVAAEGDPSVLDVDRQKIVDALRLADLWLDETPSFSTGIRLAPAWRRSGGA